MSSKSKWYAVLKGHNPGVYDNWETVEENTKGFSGAAFKGGFKSYLEAEEYLKANMASDTTATEKSQLDLLTAEQRSVINQLLSGNSVFLTGGGGVGKSHVISTIYKEYPALKRELAKRTNPDGVPKLPRIQVCALTGCAALLLGNKAKTIHSWAGVGLGKDDVSTLQRKIRRNAKAMRNWLCTDLLIIDEISMMTPDLFDKLNELAKRIRSNKHPFGGIQVLLVGDFYQLPPVRKGDEPHRFVFESDAWKEVVNVAVELTEIHRQKDPVFHKILNEARHANLSRESCAVLEGCRGKDRNKGHIKPTLIFPRRAEVDLINRENLRALEGRHYTYKAGLAYDGKIPVGFSETDEDFMRKLGLYDSDASYNKELALAMNAQVMMVANVDPDAGLVNGSRGVVVGFCGGTDLPIVEFANGLTKTVGTHAWPIEDFEFVARTQIPLRLAYATTIHSSQGSSLDSALVDIGSGIFEFGQAYVALSRCRSLEALYVYDFDPTAFKVHPKVREFYTLLSKSAQNPGIIGDSPSERGPKDLVGDLKAAGGAGAIAVADKNLKAIIAEGLKPVLAVNVIKEPSNSSEVSDSVIKEDNTLVLGTFAKSPNWLFESVPDSWKDILSSVKSELGVLSDKLTTKEFLPPRECIWRALELTPLESIKVVILGQDPYPTRGNAMGLSFSVEPDVKPLPASLKNIYKEMEADLGIAPAKHGSLIEWAKRGVMLLNTVLTVEEGAPQSHAKLGWEEVTDQIIRSIAARCEGVIFVLWGKSAQVKKKILDLYLAKNKHRVFESAHPSPLSASKGFFGSRPFSTVNTWLGELGREGVDWSI
jgi:ATP-dependent DNA helicase PIF1